MPDKLIIEVLATGILKVSTGTISDANHLSAEEFMQGLVTSAGGDVQTEANTERDILGTHHHTQHEHDHERQ